FCARVCRAHARANRKCLIYIAKRSNIDCDRHLAEHSHPRLKGCTHGCSQEGTREEKGRGQESACQEEGSSEEGSGKEEGRGKEGSGQEEGSSKEGWRPSQVVATKALKKRRLRPPLLRVWAYACVVSSTARRSSGSSTSHPSASSRTTR